MADTGPPKHAAAGDATNRMPRAEAPVTWPPSRTAIPPDARPTAIIPPVRDDFDPRLRDPIDAVKAALDGTPPPKPPTGPPPPAGGGGGGDGSRPNPLRQINWK